MTESNINKYKHLSFDERLTIQEGLNVFPLILTDNGVEFSNVYAIENNENGEQETKLFFCDPFQSSQKPYVEKNHTVLRDYIPKGTSFDDYTQDTIDLIL